MSDTLEDIDTSQLDNVGRVKVDTPSNVTILDITEDCTRLVFDRLTLNQLIHLRAVCHAWNHIITDICEQKSTLQISFSKNLTKIYYYQTTNLSIQDDPQFQLRKQNFLSIPPIIEHPSSYESLKRTGDGSFSEQQNDPNLGIRFIARLFPNITNFVCSINHQRMFELNYILWKWSTNLVTLTVFSHDRTAISENSQLDFVKCSELMSSLRRLHLLGESDKLDLLNVPTFGQLEEFTFDNPLLNFAPYFSQLNANCCNILRVGCHLDSQSHLVRNPPPNLPDANPELVSRLTHLSLGFLVRLGKYHIPRYCGKFKNLTHLEILIVNHQSMADILQLIVPLQKLQILELSLFNLSISRMEHYSTYNPNYRNTFPIFHNTITELRLIDKADKSYFPKFQEYQLLARTFPMLRKIHIYSNNLNKATFDAKFLPRFKETFGERVEVTFYRTNKLNIDNFLNSNMST